MRECNCIVIDDNRNFVNSATINNLLKRAAQNSQLQIKLFHLNPKEEKFVDEDGSIVMERIIAALDSKDYLNQLVHLIICDYQLGDDKINGFDIIRSLRSQLNCKKRILLYSSNIDDVVKKIIAVQDDTTIKNIIGLVTSNISEFCKRDEHLEEAMIKHLKTESEFSADLFFESELYKYGQYKFKSPYDKFENKTLNEIAAIISKQPHEGERLKKELIQQVIAYMIDMKNE